MKKERDKEGDKEIHSTVYAEEILHAFPIEQIRTKAQYRKITRTLRETLDQSQQQELLEIELGLSDLQELIARHEANPNGESRTYHIAFAFLLAISCMLTASISEVDPVMIMGGVATFGIFTALFYFLRAENLDTHYITTQQEKLSRKISVLHLEVEDQRTALMRSKNIG